MPIQFAPQMPLPSAEESNPFLNQLAKGLQIGIGMPMDFQKQQIANALQKIKLQYEPRTIEQDLATKRAQMHEQEALAGLHGEQTKEAQYWAKEGYPETRSKIEQIKALTEKTKGEIKEQKYWASRPYPYPTEEIKYMNYLDYLANPQSRGGGYSPISGGYTSIPTGSTNTLTPTPTETTVKPSTKLTTEAVAKGIKEAEENAEIDKANYFGQPPQLITYPGLNAAQQARAYTKAPDPLAEYKKQQAIQSEKLEHDRYDNTYKTTEPASKSADQLIPQVKQIVNAYDQIKMAKGRFGGMLPGFSADRYTFDKLTQDLLNKGAAALAGGRNVTQADFNAIKGAKFDPTMPEDTMIKLSNISNAISQADKDEDVFMKMAEQKHINHDMARRLYNVYTKHRPYQNQDQGQLYNNNAFIGTGSDFLTPEAVRSVYKTGDYVPPNQKRLQSENITNGDMVKFRNALLSLDSKVSRIQTMNYLENPNLLSNAETEKIKDKIPRNIWLQWRRKALESGEGGGQ